MKFTVSPEVFEKLPKVCFGVVAAYGVDNALKIPEIEKLLRESEESLRIKIGDSPVKEAHPITSYREAFKTLGINPNKYMSSIEAMARRAAKGNSLPSINTVVDLTNALSLKYMLPMGAHDMDALSGDIEVRFAAAGDTFIPFGGEQEEDVDLGELVYTDQHRVRTRRWIWRQSERGKITEASKNIFFPIDGFLNTNQSEVLQARDMLADLLERYYHCKTIKAFVQADNPSVEIY